MKRILFDVKLTEDNKRLRDYIIRTLETYKDLKKSEILEIGIGNGRFGFLIGKKFKRYYGIEPDRKYLEIADKTKPDKDFLYKLGQAEKIPFDKKFDIIIYSFSWHLIMDHKKALKEALRVLNDDGVVLIVDPQKRSEGWGDERLNKGSKRFDIKLYEKKMKCIDEGIKDLRNQRVFRIVKFESYRINLWVLNKRER